MRKSKKCSSQNSKGIAALCFFLLPFAFCLLPFLSYCQTSKTDSLQKLLPAQKQDTSRVNTLNALSWHLLQTGEYDAAMLHAQNAKKLAEKINFKRGTANAYNNIGMHYYYQGNYPEALKNYLASLKLQEEIGDKKGIAAAYNNIGNVYDVQGNYPEALKNHFAALKLREENGDKQGIANSYIGIGGVYDAQGNYFEALKNYFAALKIDEEIGDKQGIAAAYGNIGSIYGNQGNYPEALKNYLASLKLQEEIGDKKGIAGSYNNIGNVYDAQGNYPEALKNHFAALKLREEIGDKQGIADSYNNIGSIYGNQGNYPEALNNHFAALKIMEEIGDKQGIAISHHNIGSIYSNQGNYPEALKNYFTSLKMSEETGDKRVIANTYINLGTVYGKLSNFTYALFYLNKGLLLAEKVGAKSVMQNGYKELSNTYAEMKNYRDAFKYHKLYSDLKDTLFNAENSKTIARIQTLYETEKKEKEISLLNKNKEIQELKIAEQVSQLRQSRIIQSVLSVGLVLIVIISFLVYNHYKISQQTKLKSELLKQQATYTKAILQTQEEERKRIAQNLHDGIGQALSGIIINLEHFNNEIMPILHEEKQIQLHKILDSLDSVYKEMRSLSHQMLPRALKETGLVAAIADTLEKTFFNTKIKYKFDTHHANDIPEAIAAGIYRIFQELLSNLLKHARASEASVQLYKNKNQLILIVEDNGIGMSSNSYRNSDKTHTQDGIGLLNIAGRVQAMNGTFSIEPGPFKGTVISVKVLLLC